MKKMIITIALIFISSSVSYASFPAFFTGQQHRTATVTHQLAWACQYERNGTLFWLLFQSSCPPVVYID